MRDKKQLPSIGKRYVSEGLDPQRLSNNNFHKGKKLDKLGPMDFNQKYGLNLLK
jgi:hypothetical protein